MPASVLKAFLSNSFKSHTSTGGGTIITLVSHMSELRGNKGIPPGDEHRAESESLAAESIALDTTPGRQPCLHGTMSTDSLYRGESSE